MRRYLEIDKLKSLKDQLSMIVLLNPDKDDNTIINESITLGTIKLLLKFSDTIDRQIPQAEPESKTIDWDAIENEYIIWRNENTADNIRILKWFKSRIPQSEPANEWSETIDYDYTDTMYFLKKYKLEAICGYLSYYRNYEWFMDTNNVVGINFGKHKFNLRKPKPTLDDKLREILSIACIGTLTPKGYSDYIQAIKDVFKEEK